MAMTYRDNMSPEALAAWDRLTAKYGDLEPTSAYRSPEHNRRVGGAKRSQHMSGNAFDVPVSGMSRENVLALIEDAREAGFQGVGVYDNALHFDVGPERAWGSDYTRKTLPEWAEAAVSAPVGSGEAPDMGTDPRNALAMLRERQGGNPAMNAGQLDPRRFMTSRPAPRKNAFT